MFCRARVGFLPRRSYTALVERCQDTRLLVSHVLGFLGAHSQGEIVEKIKDNLWEVVALLLDGEERKERKRGSLERH